MISTMFFHFIYETIWEYRWMCRCLVQKKKNKKPTPTTWLKGCTATTRFFFLVCLLACIFFFHSSLSFCRRYEKYTVMSSIYLQCYQKLCFQAMQSTLKHIYIIHVHFAFISNLHFSNSFKTRYLTWCYFVCLRKLRRNRSRKNLKTFFCGNSCDAGM